MSEIVSYFQSHEALLWYMAWSSVLVFFVSLAAVPFFIVRIPHDYFSHQRRSQSRWAGMHPVLRGILMVLKNLSGIVFIGIGLILLVMPGQGILTILVGIILLDFPGKFRLERSLVERPAVLKAINWLRKRKGKPLIVID